MPDKKNLFLSLVQFSFYFLPISIVLGSLIVNINVIVFVLLGLIYLNTNRIKIKFNLINCTLLLFFLTIIFSTLINIEILGMENLMRRFMLIHVHSRLKRSRTIMNYHEWHPDHRIHIHS